MKIGFVYSGIADEAGKDVETQVRAHRELGWTALDVRTVDGRQFTDVSDADFDRILGVIEGGGLRISSFASGIANWATKISEPFDTAAATLRRTIPRMKRAGTAFLRTMSWPNDGRPEADWRDESVRRMRLLGKMAEDAGIVIVVENCDGWASTSADAYADYFARVGSPAVKAAFDTGNPCSHGQTNTWEWFLKAKPHIAQIHIKAHTPPSAGGKGEHTWPDAGASCVEEVIADLLKDGYSGFVSIEPHLKAVIHEGRQMTDAEAAYATYVEYGRRLMALVERVAARG